MINQIIHNFDPFSVEAPIAASLLCNDAIAWTRDKLKNVPRENIIKGSRHFIKTMLSHCEPISTGTLQKSLSEAANTYNLPADVDYLIKYLKDLHIKDDAPSQFSEILKISTKQDNFIHIAVSLLFVVDVISTIEEDIYDTHGILDYSQIMEALDPWIFALHNIFLIAKTMEPGTDYLSIKVAHKVRAKKGVQAKNEKLNELREMVLQEERTLYSDIPATEAARKIYETTSPTWWTNDNGKTLLVDPTNRFTAWIREDRKNRIS